MTPTPPNDELVRLKLLDAIEAAEELGRRKLREDSLADPRLFAQLLYPPDNSEYDGFWKRYSELTHWTQVLLLAWKARGKIELMPGFKLIINGKRRRITKPEVFDLSRFTDLQNIQSREVLKSAAMVVDAIHDLAWYPLVRKEPSVTAWFGHKKEEAYRRSDQMKSAMCGSDPFFDVWGGVIVPEHRDPEKWDTKEYLDTPIRPSGVPEHSMAFLSIGSRFTGGRYIAGKFDDIENEDDRKSLEKRESHKEDVKARENERNKINGHKLFLGTYYHPQGLYATRQKDNGVLTIEMPCLGGDAAAFFDFARLDYDEQRKQLPVYNEKCRPVFPHLTLPKLVESLEGQGRMQFVGQMLLDLSMGGNLVFDMTDILWATMDNLVETYGDLQLLTPKLFCDPAIKKPENKHTGDFMAIGCVLFDAHGRIIVVDGAYRNDWGESDLFNEAGRLITTWRPHVFFMEQKFQGDINPHWRTHAINNVLPIATILPLEQAGNANKMQRINALEPYFTAGKVIFVKDTPICNHIALEMETYDRVSGAAGPDDGLDMLAQTLDPAVGGRIGVSAAAEHAQKVRKVNERAKRMTVRLP